MKKTLLLSYSFICLAISARSQSDSLEAADHPQDPIICEDAYCEPSVAGGLRAKGVEFRGDVNSVEFNGLDGTEYNLVTKLKVPILWKDHLKSALGFSYNQTQYELSSSSVLDENSTIITDNFRSYSSNIYLIKPFIGNKYLTFRASAGISGDVTDSRSEYLKFSISVLYGIKKNDYTIIGYGATFRYSLGSSIPLPFFYFNKALTDRWGIELQLPLAAKLRYVTDNKKNAFIFQTRISSYRYNVEEPLPTIASSEVQSIDFNTQFVYEREIYDFIWFSLYARLKSNLRFEIDDTENEIQKGFLVGGSIFLVPPRKFTR